jgi:hypothetical protein
MDENHFEELSKRLEDVNKVIAKLVPEIRCNAFEFFRSYVTSTGVEDTPALKRSDDTGDSAVTDAPVLERLIKDYGTSKPSENVYLLAAEWYSDYGCSHITIDAIRRRSEAAGLTIPARTDKTLKQAAENGKKLFQVDGAGFRPTVPGEMYFKETFKVKKGTKTPPAAEVS